MLAGKCVTGYNDVYYKSRTHSGCSWKRGANMADLHTIGYASFNVHEMIEVLHHYGINLIIDVRSLPYSSHYPDYNKESFEHFLKKNSIHYRNYAREFGAQQTERSFFSNEGFLDFEVFVESDRFLQGFDKIQISIEKKYTVALMCAEKDPMGCHRAIMITPVFHRKMFSIKHILSNGNFENQNDIENRLLNRYFPNRKQLNLFGGNSSDDELLARAYRIRNSEIGFSTTTLLFPTRTWATIRR